MAFRKADWEMKPPYNRPEVEKNVNIEPDNFKEYQLYNLQEDIGQKNNLANSIPEKLQELILGFQPIRGGQGQTQQLELK